MNSYNITIPRDDLDKGLYEVTIEKNVMSYDGCNDDWVLHNDVKKTYVVVENYKSFLNWLKNNNDEFAEIRFKKIAENVLLIR